MQKRQISIIVPVRNNVELTLKYLTSLKKQSIREALEIIIVDNESTDGTPEKIRAKFPGIKILTQKQNLNFSQSVNTGAKASKGKFLFITNNDVTFEPVFFQKLLQFAKSDPQIGVCGGKIITQIGGRNYQDSPAKFSIVTSAISRLKNYQKTQEVDWISGAGLLVKKYVFDLLEGFDENFPFYFEDLDFCLRIKLLGLKIIYFPETKMYHLHGSTVKIKTPKWKNDVWYESKIYFIRKHFPYWSKPIALFGQIAFCLYLLIAKRDNRLNSLYKVLKNAKKIKTVLPPLKKRQNISKNQILSYYKQGKVFTARNSAPLQQVVLKDFYDLLKKSTKVGSWHVLEFGVGHGWNLPQMTKYFGKITGVDIAPSAIMESKEYGFQNTSLKILKGETLPFKNNSFDLIVATEVLEHVADLEKTVSELKRVVKKGGYILVSVPVYLNLRGISKKVMESMLGVGTWEPARSHPGGFERFLTPGKILAQFNDCKIVATQGSHYGIAWSPPMIPLYPASLSPFFDYTLGKFPPFKKFGMAFFFLAQKN
ncbi:MAG: glycosyltransferase [Candidatus Curtissbacteria bacterium]|nr:glycosyltransferase [Candidatus Curtissbacteria bacterium]